MSASELSMSLEEDYPEIREQVARLCADFPGDYWRDLEKQPPSGSYPTAFIEALTESGYLAALIPEEFGGAGLPIRGGAVILETLNRMGCSAAAGHAQMYTMGTILRHGSVQQKAHFLPKIASGELRLQAFGVTEPTTGSDTTQIKTKAEKTGDGYVINGQKVWTTLAHRSDYGVIVARTDPEQPKHAGISMFIVDLKAPGVEIRPIHQIDGGSHFNEVFFTDVRIPANNLLGEMNNGWRQATAMLMYERVAIGSMGSGAISQPMYDLLLGAAKATGRLDDPVIRDELMKVYAMETTKSLVAMRTRAELKAGKAPGPGGSLGKLYSSVISWRFREIAMEIAGAGSQAWEPGDALGQMMQSVVLNSFQAGIAGGTDEVQRNIIGDRVLGLPRDISVDTKVPFRELRVGTQR